MAPLKKKDVWELYMGFFVDDNLIVRTVFFVQLNSCFSQFADGEIHPSPSLPNPNRNLSPCYMLPGTSCGWDPL